MGKAGHFSSSILIKEIKMAHVLAQLKLVPKTECSEAVALAKELGLELQAKRYEKPLAEDAFKALTADEGELWSWHCPTRYILGGGEQRRKLEEYAFDSVPVEVMRHWKAIKDNYAFDRYEIWTTERTAHQDPLLIGILGTHLYLLARWGLESPDQLPLKQIAQNIYDAACEVADSRLGDYPFQSAEKRRKSNLEQMRRFYHYGPISAVERILGLK
jgi:hypothetical protein